jgi:ribonuclease P protein component
MAKQFSYGRQEKLKSRKLIEQLFSRGKSFTVFPLKVLYLRPDEPMDFHVKAGVGASGRIFKKAVERNRIKRLLREAYRTEKQPLCKFLQDANKQAAIFILYIDKAMPVYKTIKDKMPVALNRLIKELNGNAEKNT